MRATAMVSPSRYGATALAVVAGSAALRPRSMTGGNMASAANRNTALLRMQLVIGDSLESPPTPLGGEGRGVRGTTLRRVSYPSPPTPLPKGERGANYFF